MSLRSLINKFMIWIMKSDTPKECHLQLLESGKLDPGSICIGNVVELYHNYKRHRMADYKCQECPYFKWNVEACGEINDIEVKTDMRYNIK